MFQITGVSTPNGNGMTIFGGPSGEERSRKIGDVLGGGLYQVTVEGMGTLTLEDVGWTPQQAWGVRLNNSPGSVWLYQGTGTASLTIADTGEVSINGTDMHTVLTPLHRNEDYLAAARRFAPVVTFYQDGDTGSEERYYPCSIDFLLARSTLRRGRRNYTGTNTTAPPGLVYFPTAEGNFHIFYHNGEIGHLVSGDGISGWRSAATRVGMNSSSGITAVVFRDRAINIDLLHIFYRDPTGNGLYHQTSRDGATWSSVQYLGLDIDGTPKAIATLTCIYLVACDHGGDGIMYAKSTDGQNWSHDYTGYNTNPGRSPGVAWYGNQFHIFFQDSNKNTGVMHITSPDGEHRNWQRPASWYTRCNTSAGPEAVAAQDALHLFYRDETGQALYHRSSVDGDNWSGQEMVGIDCTESPSGTAFGKDVYLAAQDGKDTHHYALSEGAHNDPTGSGIMVALVTNQKEIPSPTQQDLVTHADALNYLDIAPEAYAGEGSKERITAPMYFTVQETPGYVEITYVMLYAFQGGQPVHADRAGTGFNCIIENFGMHQGDIEWVTVRLDPSLQSIIEVGYACHGDIEGSGGGGWWPTIPDPARDNATYQKDGERPIVRVARNGHSCRNGWGHGTIFVQDFGGADNIVQVIDLFSNMPGCPTWRPFEPGHPGGLVPLGLTPDGHTINEDWALYRGRIGHQEHNAFESATYVDGRHLNAPDWDFVWLVDWGAEALDKIPADKKEEIYEGIGPEGPRNRPFVWNSALSPLRPSTPSQPHVDR